MLRLLALVPCLIPALALAASAEGEVAHADPAGLVRHGINLLILLAILYFALRGPLSDFLKFRRTEVKDQLDQALEAKTTAEKRYAELEGRLENFEAELAELRGRAQEAGQAERDAVVASASAAAKAMEEAAQRTVTEELRRARAELRAEAVDLSVQIAEDILKKNINEADQSRLTGAYLDKVEETARS